MNYLLEIKAFYDWLETHELDSGCISLWHALMTVWNKTGWKNGFTVANTVLQSKAGLSLKMLIQKRKRLHEMGLVVYQERPGRQAPVYYMRSLTINLSVEIDSQSVSQVGSQDSLSPNLTVEIDSHLGSITKLNETKQNISNHHDHDHLRDMIISTLGKGSVNPGSVASLIALQESGTSDDMILWSLQRAAQANKHVGYAVGTIKRLRDQGIHTVAEAEAASSIQIDRPLTSNTVPTHNRDERYATFYALMGGKE